ncbi:uncharacterized protein LOC143146774 isoform X2 [Ptiloglossa arizonensis]
MIFFSWLNRRNLEFLSSRHVLLRSRFVALSAKSRRNDDWRNNYRGKLQKSHLVLEYQRNIKKNILLKVKSRVNKKTGHPRSSENETYPISPKKKNISLKAKSHETKELDIHEVAKTKHIRYSPK